MSTPKDQYDALGDEEKLELLKRFADDRRDAFRRFLRDEFPEQLPTQPGDVEYDGRGVARLKREVA